MGQRLFFLHDGRTQDLLQAIEAHYSPPGFCFSFTSDARFEVNGIVRESSTSQVSCKGSEANAVIASFNALAPWQKQGILDFLRSL